jgi:hypothetical protein
MVIHPISTDRLAGRLAGWLARSHRGQFRLRRRRRRCSAIDVPRAIERTPAVRRFEPTPSVTDSNRSRGVRGEGRHAQVPVFTIRPQQLDVVR